MSKTESPHLTKIHQDIHMAALSLNAALLNLQEAVGDLELQPHLARLLKDTDRFLKTAGQNPEEPYGCKLKEAM
jgi:hypothetical protein